MIILYQIKKTLRLKTLINSAKQLKSCHGLAMLKYDTAEKFTIVLIASDVRTDPSRVAALLKNIQ